MDKQLRVIDRFHLLIVETGEIIPAFAGGTGGGGGEPPPMSAEERNAYAKQAQAYDLYFEQSKKQSATADALEPYLYKQLGLKKSQVQGEREQNITRLQEQLKATPTTISMQEQLGGRGNRGGGGGFINRQVANPAYTQLQAELKSWQDKSPTYSIDELPPDEAELQRREIQGLANKREIAALKGELPVDPSVEQDIARGKSNLTEELVRRGIKPGSGDIYNRAVSEYERGAGALRYGVRSGEMTTADAIASGRQLELQRKQSQYIDQATGQTSGAANLLAQGGLNYGGTAQNLTRNRLQGYEYGVQQSQASAAGTNSLISGGMGAAATIGTIAFMA